MNMFVSRAFRPASQLARHVRRYASESTQSGGSTNALLYGGVGVGALGGGYYFYNRTQAGAAAAANQGVAKAEQQGSSEPKKIFLGGDQGFVSLALDSTEDVNHNTKKFRFKFEDSEAVSGMQVASALLTRFKGENDEKPTVKPYTPVSDENEKGYLDFLIKKYPNGPMSEHIHSLKPGDQLEIKGPNPKYPWAANKHPHIACIAGGTGITPMWQLINAIFKNPDDQTKVTLVFGNVTEEDILLRKDFDALEKKYPQRFRAFYVLDNPPDSWQSGRGFITKDLLKETIPGPDEQNIKVFVCGPPGLYKAIAGQKPSPAEQGDLTGYLKELGYTSEQVYKF